MNLYHRLKDLFDNIGNKIILFFIWLISITANLKLISPKSDSASQILSNISLTDIYLAILVPAFISSITLSLAHELYKLFKIERKGDIAISAITSIILFIILSLRNLLVVLTEQQFNLIITLFGLPGLVFLPKLFAYLLKFRYPDTSNTDHSNKDKKLNENTNQK